VKTYPLDRDLLAHGIVYTTLESGVRAPKPSRFRRLLWLYGIPLFFMVVLSVFGADVVRVVNWGMG
jgi:hypothetical protein